MKISVSFKKEIIYQLLLIRNECFYPVIIVKSNELVLYIYEGLLGEEVKNGEIIFTRLTVCPLDWEGRYRSEIGALFCRVSAR